MGTQQSLLYVLGLVVVSCLNLSRAKNRLREKAEIICLVSSLDPNFPIHDVTLVSSGCCSGRRRLARAWWCFLQWAVQ